MNTNSSHDNQSSSSVTATKQLDVDDSIKAWVQARLEEANDRAIYQYLRTLKPSQIADFSAKLRSLVERQEIAIGRSTYVNQYFAVPVVIRGEVNPESLASDWLETAPLLKTFHRHGLLGNKEGITLLETIVGHGYLDGDSPSSLYGHAQSLFMTSVAGTQTIRCAEASPVMPIALGGQYVTLCYLVGVTFWKKGAAEPSLLGSDPVTLASWRRHAQAIIGFGLAQYGTPASSITVGAPQPLFSAFEAGHMALVDEVLQVMIKDITEYGDVPTASFEVSPDGLLPMRNNLRVHIKGNDDFADSCSFDVQTDEVKGLSTTEVVRKVEAILAGSGIQSEGVTYANQSSEKGLSIRLH